MDDSEAKCEKCEVEVREEAKAADVPVIPMESVYPYLVQGLQDELDRQYRKNEGLVSTLIAVGLVTLYSAYKHGRFLLL